MVDEKGVVRVTDIFEFVTKYDEESMMLSSHKFFTEHTACCEIRTQITVFSDP